MPTKLPRRARRRAAFCRDYYNLALAIEHALHSMAERHGFDIDDRVALDVASANEVDQIAVDLLNNLSMHLED